MGRRITYRNRAVRRYALWSRICEKNEISVKDIYAFALENREKIDSIAFATADPAVKKKSGLCS